MEIIGTPIGQCHEEISPGDHLKVECNGKRGKSWLTGKVKSIEIVEKVVRYPMIKLESGWCIHQDDIVVEHTPQLQEEGRNEQVS